MTGRTYNVIVIGGGVIGSSCAYHLVEAGVEDVLVLERDRPASKASGRAAGHLSTYTSQKYGTGLSEYCREFHESLANRHDSIVLYRDTDYVLSLGDESLEQLEALKRESPESFERLTPAELADQAPAFDSKAVAGALVYSDAVHTDPYSVTLAILEEAQDWGAEFKTEGVTEIERHTDEFSVTTTEDVYRSEVVVNAAGAWSPPLAAQVGVTIPLKPRTSQIVVLEGEDGIDLPMFHCPDLGLYGRTEPNGDILIGGGTSTVIENPDEFVTEAMESYVTYVAERMPMLCPHLSESGLVNDWAGRCTATPDRSPLVGQIAVPGFYICAGFNGGGVARAPFAGRLIADLVCDRPPMFDPEPFRPDRFDGGADFDVKSASTDW